MLARSCIVLINNLHGTFNLYVATYIRKLLQQVAMTGFTKSCMVDHYKNNIVVLT